ncbi:Reverse transcriptase RNA-dependent DNA polymerase [Trinorchestia longiramus]|nr:Reverse transcriptase RNA-dependent DNA polymerase [Trinorchestia longiramus]
MLMDVDVQKSYIVQQMDVCTAYLHAKIDCNVFVEQPEGFIEFVVKQDSIEMKQSKYVEKILSKFRMSDCNPKSILCDPSANKLDVSSDSKNLCDPKLFREIVGSLIYLMTCTRPDICYVVTLLSQHLTRPTNAHLNLCKYVLKYLKGTILFGLKFVISEDPMQITGFPDSDWGGSSDRKSISGYVFKSSSSSSLISWKSKKQNIVALSSCEAEYIALTYAVQEGIFLKQLLCDMDGYDEPVGIFVDNRGAIDLAKNPVYRHIDIRYHFIRAIIQDNKAVLSFVPSEENMSDMFTKPVTRQSLLKFKVCA